MLERFGRWSSASTTNLALVASVVKLYDQHSRVLIIFDQEPSLQHPFLIQQKMLRISVIAIARFGLFRSPDPAVFLSSYFYAK